MGEMIQIDEHIFQMGWSHQVNNYSTQAKIPVPSLKRTAKAPEKLPKPNRKPDRLPGPSFFRGKLAVKLGGVWFFISAMNFLLGNPVCSQSQISSNHIMSRSDLREGRPLEVEAFSSGMKETVRFMSWKGGGILLDLLVLISFMSRNLRNNNIYSKFSISKRRMKYIVESNSSFQDALNLIGLT